MCGVIGLLSRDSAPICKHALINATQTLAHRGPDGEGVWIDAAHSVGLGHRRLAMNAIASGAQPLLNEDQSVVAVVNGEFYGHKEIRARMESLGHRFVSDVDSEIVVHLYEEYGDSFVDHLRGEFSIVLWDDTRSQLLAVRDRFGIKPLVYTESGGLLAVASEAKALFSFQDSVDWDMESLMYATHLQYIPPSKTLFRGIQQVPPGNMLIADRKRIHLKTYWQFDYPDDHSEPAFAVGRPSYKESVQRVRELLVESVAIRCPDEVPFAFHLSGGVDSSAVLGIASQRFGQQNAFTIGFEGSIYDERDVARRTASFCGAQLHEVVFSPENLIGGLYQAARDSEGLAINGHLPAKWMMNQLIRKQGYKCVLTGEGADEAFAGYAHLQLDWLASQGKKFDANAIENANQTSVGIMLPTGTALSTEGVRSRLGFVPTFLSAKASLGARILSFVDDPIIQGWSSRDPFGEMVEDCSPEPNFQNLHPVHKATWLWSKLTLAGYILKTLGDGVEMAASLEGRTPFLDHHLFEYAKSLPLSFSFRGLATKQVLRDAVQPFVTDEVYRRVKQPFATPPLLLSKKKLVTDFLHDQIDSEAFRAQPLFAASKVKSFLNDLDNLSEQQRQAWDPAVISLSTLVGLQQYVSGSNETPQEVVHE